MIIKIDKKDNKIIEISEKILENSLKFNEEEVRSNEYLKILTKSIFDRINILKDTEKVNKLMKFRALYDLYKLLKSLGLSSFHKVNN